MRIVCAFVLLQTLIFWQAPPSTRAAEPGRISLDDARILAHGGLKVLGEDGPTVDLAAMKFKYAPDFYAFEVTWPNPNGSPVLGFIAVNPWTGDVWNLDSCGVISSTELIEAQDAIRRRLAVSESEYEQLHERTPSC